jgi:hypothetical protein
MQLVDYLPIAVMFVLAVGFVSVSLVVSRMAVQRFPVKFYLVAMLFVIFDVEIIFLFAWAVLFPQLGWYGIAAVGIFTFFVLETLVYVWKRGALDWYVRRRARYQAVGEEQAA